MASHLSMRCHEELGLFVPEPSHRVCGLCLSAPDVQRIVHQRHLMSVAGSTCSYSLGYSAHARTMAAPIASGTVTPMPRPISGNQLDKLGKRLAQGEAISDEDYELLGRVAETYQALTDQVQERLQALGFDPTTRGFKSTGTLVDKLRRTHLSLKDIQDLAGARIVIDGDRSAQDRAVERIVEAFHDCPKPPAVVDRRANPSYGYRAVHVIVYVDGMPMEIQVRTKLQDAWAQISEKLGDIWGRGPRYGAGPDLPDSPVVLGSPTTRGAVVDRMAGLADLIDEAEIAEGSLSQIRETMLGASLKASEEETLTRRLEEITLRVQQLKEQLRTDLDTLSEQIGQLGGPS